MKNPLISGISAALVAGLIQAFLTGRGDPRLGYWLLAPIIGFFVLRKLSAAGSEGPAGRLQPIFRRQEPASEPNLPASLRRSERLVRHGPRDVHTASHRLLPTLRQLADDRLKDRYRVTFVDPEARLLLGEDVWKLLAPNWSQLRPSSGPGPSLDELDRAVRAIEEIR